jgi:tetratricopeptide (TPR) repeat protein
MVMLKGILPALAAFFLFWGAAIAAEPASSRDLREADRLCASGKYEDALVLYQKTLSAPPAGLTAGDINSKIGDAHFRLADYRSALNAYRKAVRDQRPADRAQTQYWIGFCCFLVGRDAEAIDELLKVPALYPDARAWGTTAYYWAGRASERMGKKEQAAEYYRKAGGNGKSTQSKFARKKAEAARGTAKKAQTPNSH